MGVAASRSAAPAGAALSPAHNLMRTPQGLPCACSRNLQFLAGHADQVSALLALSRQRAASTVHVLRT